MKRFALGILASLAGIGGFAHAQKDTPSPTPPLVPAFPPALAAPSGIGPQNARWNDLPGAPMPAPPGFPGIPGALVAPPSSPSLNPHPGHLSAQGPLPENAPGPGPERGGLITFLESSTPYVQAFDVLLMLFCGAYCVRSTRRRPNPGIVILAISCFFAALILLGFFLSAAPNGVPIFPFSAETRAAFYISARIFAPFELLLFALGIIFAARANRLSGLQNSRKDSVTESSVWPADHPPAVQPAGAPGSPKTITGQK